ASRPTPRYDARSPSGPPTAPPRTSTGALAAIAQLPHDRRHLLRRDRLAVAMVDGDERRRRAAAQALDRPQGHLAVSCRLTGPDAELALERLEHCLRVDESAADVRADLDHVPADRLELEHVVEARDGHA